MSSAQCTPPLEECPLCSQKVVKQRLSFEFDFFMCENPKCSFPFSTAEFDDCLIGDRSLPAEAKKIKKRKATSPDSSKTKVSKRKTTPKIAEPQQSTKNPVPLTSASATSNLDNTHCLLADLEKIMSPDQPLPLLGNCGESHRAAGANSSYSLEDIEQLLNSSTQFDLPEYDSNFTNILDDLNYTIENTIA
ncbi:hypothetical protein K493DRAFT_334402 [Basidiobolus meristosporus CBS 931.73]|uniref:Uncharacterized protein n=1 Tax=Basidiobolus meristosporus CBS 931.73 TaxID=1314790 RepID=A0A1Y1YY79_9FUNG|nr:hypothetical protein K493DRAFT_334402 [Basidiobolus meristosporus CBS 931.73]|eukprot:ORY02980.1 hypothetical protein K493DRAFT_334402 [Basidiobolus meristosporus CBS 931.73]